MHTVDIHNHYIPGELIWEARRHGSLDGLQVFTEEGTEWVVHRQGYRYQLDPAFHDLEARIRTMNGFGIEVAVLSLSPTLFFYWVDASEASDFCRMANDSLAKFCKESEGKIAAVATLPMQDPDAAVRELRRAVTELGLRGAEIGPRVEETPLDDSSMLPILEEAEHLAVPLILHPYYVGPRPGLEDYYLTNLVGNPLDTSVAAARLILSGTMDRLEHLELVLLHGGGFLPYQIGRLDHGSRVRPEARACRQPPSSYLTRFLFDTLTHLPKSLSFLIDLVGADRVAYGTDSPFDMAGGSLKSQLGPTEIDPDTLAKVAHRNAEQIFRLNGVT